MDIGILTDFSGHLWFGVMVVVDKVFTGQNLSALIWKLERQKCYETNQVSFSNVPVMEMFQVIACETERSSVLLAKCYYEVDCCSAVISCSIQQKFHRKKDEIFLK